MKFYRIQSAGQTIGRLMLDPQGVGKLQLDGYKPPFDIVEKLPGEPWGYANSEVEIDYPLPPSILQVLRTMGVETVSPIERAVEHAEYMATSAEWFIDAVNVLAMAKENDTGDQSSDYAVDAATMNREEAMSDLRSMIHEFRKRRDRAKKESSGCGPCENNNCPSCHGSWDGNLS